ncbi:hypothetical protein D3C85_1576570 [compost metagenome]
MPQCATDSSLLPGFCICSSTESKFLSWLEPEVTRIMSETPNTPIILKLPCVYLAEATVNGATAKSGPAVASKVYPSGCALSTFMAAIEPFAPGMLSMTSACPSTRCSTGTAGRTVASTPKPAG